MSNKLRCLLISVKDAYVSSASIDLHVGSATDPKNLQGLANLI